MKNVFDFAKAKLERRPISMVTCYDSTSAALVARSSIDCVLVGDSVSMTMHGEKDTLRATIDLLALHTAAVRRGGPDLFIVADMPFLAHRGSVDKTMEAVRCLMQAGANAVKIEGVDGSEQTLKHIVESGVPVMGHLGLTPQSLHALGGFRVQGKEEAAAAHITEQALTLQSLGIFALVLECVPNRLATAITKSLDIPTIGIGAGHETDGQVLVFQDLLGLNPDFKPRFVRKFADGASFVVDALNRYTSETQTRSFPAEKESFEL